MAKLAVPARISWAIERLNLSGDETILEVGCGRGVAAALVGEQLTGGRIVAVDRSATATSATLERPENQAHLNAGKLEVVTTALANLSGYDTAFDLIFAINVNVFWIDPAREMPVVRRVLKRGGRLALFYEPPSVERAREAARLVEEKLAEHGFGTRLAAFDEGGKLLHIEAQPRG